MKTQDMTVRKTSQDMSHDEFVAYAQAEMKRLEGNEGQLVETSIFTFVFSWRSQRGTFGHPAITFEWYEKKGN